MPIRARADRSLVRAGARSRRVVRVDVTAPEAAQGAERPRLALSLVLDRSGSMEGKKIELAREAAVSAIRSLGERDRFAVVVYDHRVDVLQAAVDASAQSVDAAARTIERVEALGSTDLHGGWEAGCREAFGSISDQRLARVLLLSDGLANHGLTDRGEIARRASERRLSGVTTSTFGIGADYDEGLLSSMAEAGGGNFRYVATAGEIPRYVSDEMSEVLALSLPEAEIEVRGPEGLEVECPNEFPVRRVDGAFHVAIGSLVSEQRLSLLLDVRFPQAPE
ncbi:VWA domain-containing protein, partial [Acidobacteria bacterium ACD]|nr:VWA domain-containing protein [Acidobacteria bacterium ACD]